MHKPSMRDRFRGALVGVAIGDGIGKSVETMTHDEIMALNNGMGVTGFMESVQTTFPEVALLPPTATTDDWQLTAIVARALIRSGGSFRLFDCAAEHIAGWRRDNCMWGKSSRSAIGELAENRRMLGIYPAIIPGKTGLGNGVVMKISPLALVDFFVPAEQQINDCAALGSLTHGDPRATIAAYAIMRTMHTAMGRGFDGLTAGKTEYYQWLDWEVREMERRYADAKLAPGDQISGRLNRVRGMVNPKLIRETAGCSFVSTETAPFTIATFLRHPDDFRAGVLEVVNAGGDTDTHASIVGAMIGANVGIGGLPPEWVEACPVRNEAFELADALLGCVAPVT